MNRSGWRAPAPPLRGRVFRAAGLGCVGVGALGVLMQSMPYGGSIHPLGATLLFAAMMTVVIGTIGSRHPFPSFGPANYATMLRAMLLALVASVVGAPADSSTAWAVVAATAVAAALDGVDGWIARRTGTTSEFGARFDMETDAFLILVLSVLVWQHQKAGVWVLGCGLMRYGFVAAGWMLTWMAAPLRSTRRGKATAIAQMGGLGVALAPTVPPPLASAVAATTLAVLVWSFAIDVRFLWQQRPRGREMP